MEDEMTFKKFISEAGTTVKPFAFVVLDQPVDIVARPNRFEEVDFKAIALAVSGPRMEQPFIFALAVSGVCPAYRFTTLSRYFGGPNRGEDPKKDWVVARAAIFHPWVQNWLMNNPFQMFAAGVALGRASKTKKKK
jgi:hypothetical protein